MKYGKWKELWQVAMDHGNKIWNVKRRVKSTQNSSEGMSTWKCLNMHYRPLW